MVRSIQAGARMLFYLSVEDKMNPKDIVDGWAMASCETLERLDVEAHMDLISKDVKVYGLADKEYVDYNFWREQVKEQFSQGMVKSVRYYLHAVRADSDSLILFTAIEYLTDATGKEHESPLEVALAKEEDGVWRVIQEKVLTEDQAQTAGLLAVLH